MIDNNFCWMATWKVTDRCNLRCTYCDPTIMLRATEPEEIDRFEALGRIAKYKPRILNISGGEPSLVTELPTLLALAKEGWNPFIRVVHNGTGPHKFEEAFRYIDRLVISVDGPGDINASTRGISGDTVLERIAKLFDDGLLPRTASGEKLTDGRDGLPTQSVLGTEIIVNTVVTENNIDALPAFAAQIAAVSPHVMLALLPVMPIESTLSILRDREAGYRRFLEVYARVKAAHGNAIHNLDCIMRHENLRKIKCYNQYFTIRFSPRGEFFTCGANIASQLRRSDGAIKKVFRRGGVKKLFTMIMKSLNAKAGKVDFTCRNICNCESWLDMTLLGRDTEYAPIVLRGLRGRLTDGDYCELEAFVKKNINAYFDAEHFKMMVDGK